MAKIKVTYDVQQPHREIDVSDDAIKYFRLRKDGDYGYSETAKERAIEEIISKLQEFHSGQHIEVVDVEIL